MAEIENDIADMKIDFTPNIEFQVSNYHPKEYIGHKLIPDNALFINTEVIEKIKTIYAHNLDIPLLIYGKRGIGKTTSLIGLLKYIPSYCPEKSIERKINNIRFFKSINNDFPKLLTNDNIFFLNMKIMNTHTETIDYLAYIQNLARNKNLSQDKNIFIFTNIDHCTENELKFLSIQLDNISEYVGYVLTCSAIGKITPKIRNICAKVFYKALTEEEFVKVFRFNYKNVFDSSEMTSYLDRQYYKIYLENGLNIGNTLCQIKYNLCNMGKSFINDPANCNSILNNISAKFINDKLVLSNVASALEIRKYLYNVLALGINSSEFVREVVKQLLAKNLNLSKKYRIMEMAAQFSVDIKKANKEIVIMESFFYELIVIIYS